MARYAKLELENSQGNESTTTGVFATPFYLPATEIGLNPGHAPLDRSDEQRGVDGRLPLAENEYEPEGEANFRAYANYLGALLYVLFGDVVTTAGNGIITDPAGSTIPAGAYRHVFSKLTGVTPKSARLTDSYGDQWYQARGVTIPSMEFALEDDGVAVSASLMSNYVNRLTSDPANTPSYDDFGILPFRRRNVELDWGVGSANIESIGFTLEQDLEYVRDMGIRTGWPTDTERANSPDGFLRLTGDLTRRQLDTADWEALIAADDFAVEVLMQSEQNIGATNYPYSLWVEAPYVQYTEGTVELLKNQPRHQMELGWAAGYSFDDEYDFKATLVNGQAAYE